MQQVRAPMQNLLSSAALLDRILIALNRSQPLSVVSVGATEAFVMAQYAIYSESEILSHPEARAANLGARKGFLHRGLRFPNLEARDAAVDAVRKADIVGYNTIVEPARRLTERVFQAWDLKPARVFEAHLRRVLMFSQRGKFQEILDDRKVLLVGTEAPRIKGVLKTSAHKIYRCKSIEAVVIDDFVDIKRVGLEIQGLDFDVCLLAAGVNALILAPYIARTRGKVAFDLGSGLISLATGKIVMDGWLADIIGIDRLMNM